MSLSNNPTPRYFSLYRTQSRMAKPSSTSAITRITSFLSPNPPLQHFPFDSNQLELPALPPRAASPSSSFASSHASSHVTADPNRELDVGCRGQKHRERTVSTNSAASSVHIVTAQRARGSIARLVDLLETTAVPEQVESSDQAIGNATAHVGWIIDYFSAKVLPM